MVFTKRLREGIRRGRIRCSIRVWTRPHVKVGGRYRMDDGHIVVDSITPIGITDITYDLARESGFESVEDLLRIARHGSGDNVYLIRFHYLPAGAWDPASVTGTDGVSRSRRRSTVRVTSMRANDFRRIALGMKGAIEGAHMGHPDFRVNNRIFATLHDDREFGMVKLTPDQQEQFTRAHPDTFALESGAWGLAGCTRVRLASVDEEALGEAVTLAWQNIVNKGTSTRTRKRSARPAQRSKKR